MKIIRIFNSSSSEILDEILLSYYENSKGDLDSFTESMYKSNLYSEFEEDDIKDIYENIINNKSTTM